MRKQILITAITACVVITFCSLQSNAKVWRVNNQGFSADFTSLDTAINYNVNFAPGDTIHLEASGTNYPSITITEKVVIIGPGYFLNFNDSLQKNTAPATIQGITFSGNAAGSKLIGVSINNATSPRILIGVNDILIERCYIGNAIQFLNNNPNVLNNITIKQCYNAGGIITPTSPGPITNLIIFNSYFGGVTTFSDGNIAVINNYQGAVTNCVFNANVNNWSGQMIFNNNIFKSGTFFENNNSTANVNYNLFVATALPTWLSGSNNVFKPSNVFIAATSSPDFDLNVRNIGQCPECYQGFPSGTQMGIYGGAAPYKLSGIANIPAIYLLQAPTPVIQGTIVPVDIKTRSNN